VNRQYKTKLFCKQTYSNQLIVLSRGTFRRTEIRHSTPVLEYNLPTRGRERIKINCPYDGKRWSALSMENATLNLKRLNEKHVGRCKASHSESIHHLQYNVSCGNQTNSCCALVILKISAYILLKPRFLACSPRVR
jgi:hypothetical protein